MIPRNREALSQLLARTFPHSQEIDGATLDAFVDGLLAAETRVRESAVAAAAREQDHGHQLFLMRATHARRTPITSVFTGITHSVRVRLPESEPAEIETPVGVVLPRDHLLSTVAAVRERFADRITGPLARIELITAGRGATNRFSPMSLYFGYESEEAQQPSFVIYEPGDALGKPGALYFGATVDTVIEERAGYKPTSLSSPDHWYNGGLRMAEGGCDPKTLYMRASVERGGEPHFRLHVEYELIHDPCGVSPIGDLVEAAMRMLAVEQGTGVDHNLVEKLVAEAGLLVLPWVERPDSPPEHQQPPLREGKFEPSRDFDSALAELPAAEQACLQASVALLLGAVVRADGKFDELERVEMDWTMNFEVPAFLGEAFRFSPAADQEYEAMLAGSDPVDGPRFDARLAELGVIVRKLPAELRGQYGQFVINACAGAARASGGWLWFGNKVSKAEKHVLERIAAALDLEG